MPIENTVKIIVQARSWSVSGLRATGLKQRNLDMTGVFKGNRDAIYFSIYYSKLHSTKQLQIQNFSSAMSSFESTKSKSKSEAVNRVHRYLANRAERIASEGRQDLVWFMPQVLDVDSHTNDQEEVDEKCVLFFFLLKRLDLNSSFPFIEPVVSSHPSQAHTKLY